jgi:hypothetical protein
MMTCVCAFTPAGRNAATASAWGDVLLAIRDEPPDRVIVWWPGVAAMGWIWIWTWIGSRGGRTVVVLGHVDSRGGSRGNLRAAVDQRAERFFRQNIPAPHSTKRAAYRVPSRARLDVRAGVRGVHGEDRLGWIAGLPGLPREGPESAA